MNDLYFENELKNREREKIKRRLEEYIINFNSKSDMSETTRDVLQNFEDVLDVYYSRMFEDTKDYEEIYEMIESFKQQLTDDELSKMYDTYNFSEEERDYIKLVQSSSTWRGEHSFNIGAKYAVTDILLRAKIIEQFGEETLQTFRNIIQEELPKDDRKTINHYMQLLSDKPYGENIHTELESSIEEKTSYRFNQRINCGGYALKIDQCVFPTYQKNFSQSISSILEKFPFVRLLGDKQLEDDEYLVIYRAPKGKNTGHHFIRVDSDASVREKDSSGEPRIFENWGSLSEEMEAIFAVKKEHKMFEYNSSDINYNNNNGLDFEETVAQAIRERQNSFSYHNHDFCLKKSKQDEIFVTTVDGEIVADVVADEEECLVEVGEDKIDYVENFSGAIKPIISNGKLINFNQFKERKRDSIEDDGRS